MSQIILMRHGRPQIDLDEMKALKMSSIELGKIVDDYENTPLSSTSLPPEKAMRIAEFAEVSFSSDFPRAISSIEKLGLTAKNEINQIFRESKLPYLKLERPRLRFFTWAITYRILWLLGFKQNGESITVAKRRAFIVANKLENAALEHRCVLQLGHGIMNRLVVKQLKRRNWKVTENAGENYWSYTVMTHVPSNHSKMMPSRMSKAA